MYGVSNVAVSRRVKIEGWRGRPPQSVKSAKKEIKQIAAAVNAAENKEIVAAAGRELMGAVRITEKAMSRADVLLDDPDLTPSGLRSVTGAIIDCVRLLRDFYGVPTPAEAEAQRIARERLKMDQRRLEIENTPAEPLEVVFTDTGGAEL